MKATFHFELTFFLCAIIALGLSSCDRRKYNSAEGMIWNTVYHITYEGDEELADSILIVLDSVGKSLSIFDKNSLVSKVNASDSTIVDDMLREVYLESLKINKASKGMFDPTVSPLITAWGFGPGHEISADTLTIDSILQYTGLHKTRLDGKMLIKDDIRTQFNFSAIAKGYGCDKVGAMLRRNGVRNYLVEIGGEISAGGKSPRNDNWNISIDKPEISDSLQLHISTAVISITDCGVATSGNYRNFHEKDGSRFGHTISPATGRPVATDVISATVVAPTCMEADGAATACMAAGAETARFMLSELRYEGMLILADSTVWMSPGFKKLILNNP